MTTPNIDLGRFGVFTWDPGSSFLDLGLAATPEQAQEVHAFIRSEIAKKHGQGVADVLRILYGGSVKPDNVKGLMALPDVDGALVGGASLKADSFLKLVHYDRA